MAQWLSWLERRPVTAEVTGSSPVWVVSFKRNYNFICWYGGIGRRKGLKIPRDVYKRQRLISVRSVVRVHLSP